MVLPLEELLLFPFFANITFTCNSNPPAKSVILTNISAPLVAKSTSSLILHGDLNQCGTKWSKSIADWTNFIHFSVNFDAHMCSGNGQYCNCSHARSIGENCKGDKKDTYTWNPSLVRSRHTHAIHIDIEKHRYKHEDSDVHPFGLLRRFRRYRGSVRAHRSLWKPPSSLQSSGQWQTPQTANELARILSRWFFWSRRGCCMPANELHPTWIFKYVTPKKVSND